MTYLVPGRGTRKSTACKTLCVQDENINVLFFVRRVELDQNARNACCSAKQVVFFSSAWMAFLFSLQIPGGGFRKVWKGGQKRVEKLKKNQL